jgi:multiple sugar transport system substrate-binding protein
MATFFVGLIVTGSSTGSPGSTTGVRTSAADKTTITFWQVKFEDFQQSWFAKYVKRFNASQDKVLVKYYVVPGDVWTQKLKAAQAAGTQPDLITTAYGAIRPGVTNGEFAQLDGLLPGSDFADIKRNIRSFVTIDGKHYAYPMLAEPSTVLYYRKDLAKAAGLDPNKPPQTWSQLVTWAKKLTNGNVKGIATASNAVDLGWSTWGLQYNACGHLPVTPDWSKAKATDTCYQRLMTLYKTLYQAGLMPQQPKAGYPDATPYGDGEVAMMANGSWAIGSLKAYFPKLVSKTAVAPFPSWDGKATRPTATLGGWTLTIDAKSKNKQATAAFIHYLLAGDPKIMADFFKLSSYSKFAVRTSVDKVLSNDPKAGSDPFMKVIASKVVAYGRREPSFPFDISLAMGTAIESVMKGSSSIADAQKKADDTINRVIDVQRLAGTGNGN